MVLWSPPAQPSRSKCTASGTVISGICFVIGRVYGTSVPANRTVSAMDQSDDEVLVAMRRAIVDGRARQLRTAIGLSRAEVARAIGVSPEAVTKWELGQRVPRGQAAVRYARLLTKYGLSGIAP